MNWTMTRGAGIIIYDKDLANDITTVDLIIIGSPGMANESTKTTQTSMRMAQHNERTRLACLVHV